MPTACTGVDCAVSLVFQHGCTAQGVQKSQSPSLSLSGISGFCQQEQADGEEDRPSCRTDAWIAGTSAWKLQTQSLELDLTRLNGAHPQCL